MAIRARWWTNGRPSIRVPKSRSQSRRHGLSGFGVQRQKIAQHVSQSSMAARWRSVHGLSYAGVCVRVGEGSGGMEVGGTAVREDGGEIGEIHLGDRRDL